MRRGSFGGISGIIGLTCLVGCAKGGRAGGDIDAGVDGCTPSTYFADRDGDGHGDPASAIVSCVQPPDTVTISDDCDDASDRRFPGATESCDAIDNDCDAATVETCPAGCTVERRPSPDDQKTYLFCANGQSWNNARTTCNGAGYKLAQIDSVEENAFVRTTANTRFGNVELHIGGTDQVTEGAWIWDAGDQFWMGGSGGAAVGGRFENWETGEPNDNGTEDCAEMRGNGQWNDAECGNGQRFVCRD